MTKRQCMLDQRQETREPAQGAVWFVPESAGALVLGCLMDISPRGFRASHTHKALSTGQHVRFRHAHGEGQALVVWNRILARNVESGFLVLGE
jgi:hypothetical protein